MFPITLNWNKVKNKLDNLKKQYELYHKIMFGSTGLEFNPMTGSLDAPDHCWKDKIKTYPEASKLRSKPLRCIPLLHVVFGDKTVVVEDSWQPRPGAHSCAPPADLSENDSLNNNADEREDPTQNNCLHPGDEWFEQVPMEFSPNLNETDPSLASQPSSSTHTQVKNVTRKRKRKSNSVDSTLDRIASTMEERNDIWEHMTSYKSKESTNSTEERMALVVKYVRVVPDLVPMTELYWASLDLIATNDVVRGLFLALPDAEKLPFLKRQTKESRNDFFDA
ncbi:unnamed protein product [Thlaspi arvense]|uniref:Myb/SANT-like domain-containing protein n=1 Tax=Thlaspi arvense TaxID=13288 RepID=A0AAU9S9I2_THLAR|nr:unnamed protein product [Thlaspi arvense]